MRKFPLLLLFFVVFMFATNAIGQESEIPKSQYWGALPSLYSVMMAESVRITKTGEYYEKGVVTKTVKIVTETLPPGKMHALEQTREGNKTVTKEAVKVSNVSYCKEGTKRWEISLDFCLSRGMSGVDSNSVMKFYKSTVELDGKKVTRYRFVATEPRRPTTPPGFPDVFEYITWIDANGRIVREDRNNSISSNGARVYTSTEIVEYNPKGVKIVAPIK